MYSIHFGLHEKPFQIVPSPKYLFYSETHDESRARMLYGIREGRGFVVISGAIGLGKTTVLMSVLEELEQGVRTALIFNPVDSFEQLLRMVAFEFGFSADGDEVTLMRELNLFLVETLSRGENCVLLIDEAQNLSLELLEKVRLLSNLQTEQASLLQIVLVGQPELLEKLHDPSLVQLRQRVGVWFEIAPLTQEETQDYILHRLQLAGAHRPKEIFPREVCRRVYDYAQGVPRLINQLADTALVIAFGRNADAIEVGHVDEAAHELRLDTALAERPIEKKPATRKPRPRSQPRAEAPVRRPLVRPTGTILVVVAILIGLVALYTSWRQGLFQSPPAGNAAVEEPAEVTVAGLNADTSADEAGPVDPAHEAEKTALVDEQEPEEDLEPTVPPEVEAENRRIERVAAQSDQVRSWRQQGKVVYTVHLASFRDADQAKAFAVNLLESHADWNAAMFVEPSGQDPIWYRVLGGGFDNRASAVSWSRELKSQRGMNYAQVARLAPQAQSMFEPNES